jgi:hypothetical protein
MTRLPVAPRDVIALTREAGRSRDARGPLLVTGVLAEQLARELAAGAAPGAVRTSGDPARAAALVRVVAGEASREDEAQLRSAVRALVPVVAVQTGDPAVRLPYVLPTDVIAVPPGKGFPVAEITTALAAALGPDGPPLAASLPVLRGAIQERLAVEGAAKAGVLSMTGADKPRLPVLALLQSRTLADVTSAAGASGKLESPQDAARVVAPQLGAALGTGFAARGVIRRLPRRNPLVEGAVAAAATYALAKVFRRIAGR